MNHLVARADQLHDALANSQFNKTLLTVCNKRIRVSSLTDDSASVECHQCKEKAK